MKEVMLSAESRSITTGHDLKALRDGGRVPAVLYGRARAPQTLSVDLKQFETVSRAHGSNMLITLQVGSEKNTTIVKEIQRDMFTNRPVHIDFQAVSLKDKIEVNVPLRVIGVAPGVKLGGGIMEHILRDLRISCLPTEIPEAIEVDVSHLEINHSIVVRDLAVPAGIEVVSDPAGIIVNIVAPTILEEPAAPGTEAAAGTTAAGAAEPEVITKGKKDKEDGEAAAAPGDKKAAPGDKKAEPAKK